MVKQKHVKKQFEWQVSFVGGLFSCKEIKYVMDGNWLLCKGTDLSIFDDSTNVELAKITEKRIPREAVYCVDRIVPTKKKRVKK